jgi:chemotaxis methyl-accepting protein methylase
VHPDEFPQLFNVLLINVTTFFRDEQAWDAIRESVLAGHARCQQRPSADPGVDGGLFVR